MTSKIIGQKGEALACDFLVQKGYKIVTQNFSCPYGEIDIIAYDKTTLVFVEVKARSYVAYGGPLAAVTQAKQQRISQSAQLFIKEKCSKFDSIRFDVVCVLPGGIEHIENAFLPKRGTL